MTATDPRPVISIAELNEPLLTSDQVRMKLRVSRMTVYRLIEHGELRAYRVGRSFRIPLSSLRAYMAAAEVGSDW